jgi:hypothetical protein
VDPAIVDPLDQFGLHGGKKGGGDNTEMEQRGKTLGMVGRIHERMLTCSMVSVPLVPALPQHVVRCSEKHTHVDLIDYGLWGTS